MKVVKRNHLGGIIILICLAFSGAVSAVPMSRAPAYRIVNTIALGGASAWDFLTFDPVSDRVYIAHGDRVDVVDAGKGERIGDISGIPGGPHGVLITTSAQGFTDDGDAGTLVPFDPKTFEKKRPIKVGADADAIAIDPLTQHLFVIGSDPGTISIVDSMRSKTAATIDAGGKLEYAVVDDRGHLYVNGAKRREIVRVDTATNRIDARWPIPGCESPHGLALDREGRRLFAGCVNQSLMVVNADTGLVIAKLPIGRGSDGIAFDPIRRRILSANGLDGTLSVIAESDADTFVPLEPVKTMISGRTLAIDPLSGRVFVAAAATDSASGGRPVPRPGSLALLVLEPLR